jgi:hypothetical protein
MYKKIPIFYIQPRKARKTPNYYKTIYIMPNRFVVIHFVVNDILILYFGSSVPEAP